MIAKRVSMKTLETPLDPLMSIVGGKELMVIGYAQANT